MPKLTLADLGNLQNETTVVSTLNSNNALIEAALENTVSRDGTSPNVMNASFDMNSNRILNLPEPISDLEPARLVDVRDGITGPQGPQGEQGPAGADGIDGTNGAVAVSGTPTVNQFANWTDATTLKGTSITGLVKGNGASAPTAAISGTDYAPATTGTSILKASSGGFANAVAGTDYVAATSGSAIQKANGSGGLTAATANTDYLPVAAPAMTGAATFAGTLVNSAGTNQYSADIAARKSGPSIEFGHGNTAGYGSVLGAELSSGAPYIALCAGPGTTSNTYKTLGLVGSVIRADTTGGFTFNKVATASADNQSLTNLATLTSAGALSATSLADANGTVYSNIPQNSQSTAYTAVLADANKHLLHPSADTTARTFTIPANSSVAYPIGTSITFVNQASAGVMTISITTDTMRMAGSGLTGNRTLTANGIATALKITSTEWIISGTGLS